MSTDEDDIWGKAFLLIFFLAVIGWPFLSNSRLRFAIQYDTDMDKVTVQEKPRDCNFFHAPLGQKDCHYDRTVVLRRIDPNSSVPAISFDGGKTWTPEVNNKAANSKRTTVFVSWVKKTS